MEFLFFRLPGLLEKSTAEIKSQKKQMCSVPEKIISQFNRQNMNASGSMFHQGYPVHNNLV